MIEALVILTLLVALGLSQGQVVTPGPGAPPLDSCGEPARVRPLASFLQVRAFDVEIVRSKVQIIPLRWVVVMFSAIARCPLLVLVVETPGAFEPAVVVAPRRVRPSPDPGWASRPLTPSELSTLEAVLQLDRQGRVPLPVFRLRPLDRSVIRGEVAQVDARGAVALVQAGLLAPELREDVDRAWSGLRRRLLDAAGAPAASH